MKTFAPKLNLRITSLGLLVFALALSPSYSTSAAEKAPGAKVTKSKTASQKNKKPTAADLKLQQMQKEVGNWDEDADDAGDTGQKSGAQSAGDASQKTKNAANGKKSKGDSNDGDGAQGADGSAAGEASEESEADESAQSEFSTTQLNNTAPKPKLDPDKELANETDDDRVSFWGTLIKAVVVLGLLSLALFYGLRFVAKRQGIERSGEHLVETLAQVPIQPNKQIRLVEVGGRVLVLGITENQISLLQTIEDQSVIDEMKLSNSERAEVKDTFWDHFKNALDDAAATPSPTGDGSPQPGKVGRFLSSLLKGFAGRPREGQSMASIHTSGNSGTINSGGPNGSKNRAGAGASHLQGIAPADPANTLNSDAQDMPLDELIRRQRQRLRDIDSGG